MVYCSSRPCRSWHVDKKLWPFEQMFFMLYNRKDALDDVTLREAEKIVIYMDAPEDFPEGLIEDDTRLLGCTPVRHDAF